MISAMQKPPLLVGVLSDTHLPYRLDALPPEIFDVFAPVDVILHAGDVDQISYLDALRDIAPLHAVRGNFHLADFSLGGRELPATVDLTLAGRRVLVTHGHRRGIMGAVLKIPNIFASMFISNADTKLNYQIAQRLGKDYPFADVIIFGHTHRAFNKVIGNTLFFNPGAVVSTYRKKPSVGLLKFWDDKVEAEIIKFPR